MEVNKSGASPCNTSAVCICSKESCYGLLKTAQPSATILLPKDTTAGGTETMFWRNQKKKNWDHQAQLKVGEKTKQNKSERL